MKRDISNLITEIFKDKSIFLDLGFSNMESEVFYYLVKGNSMYEIASQMNLPLSTIKNIRDRRFYLIPIFLRRQLSYVNDSNLNSINNLLIELNLFIKQYFNQFDDYRDKDIRELNLSKRTIHALIAGNIKTAKELSNFTVQDLQRFKNLGSKSISDIKGELLKLGIFLKV